MEELLMSRALKKIFDDFQRNGYATYIAGDSKSNGTVIKARKQGGITIYLSLLPDLKGRRRPAIIMLDGGSVIKRFMHTKVPPKNLEEIVCPHFLELKWAYGCPFNCSYCYLQGTLRLVPTQKKPIIKEVRKVKRHLLAFMEAPIRDPEVLNTGELCDSLMYEGTKFSITKTILPIFEDSSLNPRNHKVLIVTKSNNIDDLLKLPRNENTIVSFSVNTPRVSQKWEKSTSSPLSRIEAAKLLFEAGFEVRIRIDPIIPYPNLYWLKQYRELIDRIFSHLCPSRITLGSLRGLSTTIRKARDRSWLTYMEESSEWGLRPSHKVRYHAYRTIIDHLENEYGFTRIGLCKEPIQMWMDLNMDWRNCRCNCIW